MIVSLFGIVCSKVFLQTKHHPFGLYDNNCSNYFQFFGRDGNATAYDAFRSRLVCR